MNAIPQSRWGSFALVAYIPEPLRSCIEQIRGSLPGNDNSPAHITVLPPRALTLPIEDAVGQASAILDKFSPFQVELSTVCRFPETKFLYLDLAEGNSFIRHLHEALNTGDLAGPEEFDFQPHLTLGGPVPAQLLDSLQEQCETTWQAAQPGARFTVTEIAFLWLKNGRPQSEWRQIVTHRLGEEAQRSTAAAATITNRTSTVARRR